MSLTASKLRENVYQILDQVIATGVPVEIDRKGNKVLIVPVEKPDKLANLKKRNCINGDPDDLIHIDWSGEWNP